jgi:hypothetical protein
MIRAAALSSRKMELPSKSEADGRVARHPVEMGGRL